MMDELYNSKYATSARLIHNICLLLLIGWFGYITMSPWVLLGLIFNKKITLTPKDIAENIGHHDQSSHG